MDPILPANPLEPVAPVAPKIEPNAVIVLPVLSVNTKLPVNIFADTTAGPVAPTATAVPGIP